MTIISKATLLTPFLVSAAMLVISTSDASASVKHNPDIKISKADLKKKCREAGGEFTDADNGVYRCETMNGTDYTIVECKDGKCDGYVFPTERKGGRFGRFRPEQVNTPDTITAPNNGGHQIIAPSNFTIVLPSN